MKSLLVVVILFSSFLALSQFQEVKFKDGQYENGMTYPIVVLSDNESVQDKMNTDLQSKILDLKESDFCIGQYGYVQKSSHIQIHIFCTCIDYAESVNRYFLYNIQSGEAVTGADLTNPKMKEQLSTFLIDKTKSFATTKTLSLDDSNIEMIKEKTLDAFKIVLKRDGIDLWLADTEQWGPNPMYVTWIEIKKFLKYNFI